MNVPDMPIHGELEDLKTRQLAFLRERLVSLRAREEWRENLAAGLAAIVALPLRQLVDLEAAERALDAAISAKAEELLVRPASAALAAAALRELRAEPGRSGDFVPKETQTKLDELVGRPGLVPPPVVARVMADPAVEGLVRDMIRDALEEFSSKVNPFTADWGLPALMRRFSPFGLGGAGKLDGFRAEFEKRIGPEIERFLQGFGRTALPRMARLTADRLDEPEFVAMRRRLARWLLEQPLAELATLDEEGAALAAEIGVDVSLAALRDGSIRARRRAEVAAFLEARGDASLGELLGEHGVKLDLDLGPLADATFPLVASLVGSAPAQAWIAGLLGEFFDGEASRGASQP